MGRTFPVIRQNKLILCLAKSIGIERVRIIDPFDVDESVRVIKEEVNTMEPSTDYCKKAMRSSENSQIQRFSSC